MMKLIFFHNVTSPYTARVFKDRKRTAIVKKLKVVGACFNDVLPHKTGKYKIICEAVAATGIYSHGATLNLCWQ